MVGRFGASIAVGMYKPTKILVITALLVIALLGARFALVPRQTDDQMVREALTNALKASREGKPGGVLDKLSASFKLNDAPIEFSGAQVADFIKDQKPELTVEEIEPVITGDEARITSPVRLKLGLLGTNFERRIPKVTMIFHREVGHVLLLIPTPAWRLTDVQVPESDISDLTH
jgi:hypothetical protein